MKYSRAENFLIFQCIIYRAPDFSKHDQWNLHAWSIFHNCQRKFTILLSPINKICNLFVSYWWNLWFFTMPLQQNLQLFCTWSTKFLTFPLVMDKIYDFSESHKQNLLFSSPNQWNSRIFQISSTKSVIFITHSMKFAIFLCLINRICNS